MCVMECMSGAWFKEKRESGLEEPAQVKEEK